MNIEIDDHKIALLVNAITAELKPFTKWHPKSSAAQSLRARVSGIVLDAYAEEPAQRTKRMALLTTIPEGWSSWNNTVQPIFALEITTTGYG